MCTIWKFFIPRNSDVPIYNTFADTSFSHCVSTSVLELRHAFTDTTNIPILFYRFLYPILQQKRYIFGFSDTYTTIPIVSIPIHQQIKANNTVFCVYNITWNMEVTLLLSISCTAIDYKGSLRY